jgi:hypothetical protein
MPKTNWPSKVEPENRLAEAANPEPINISASREISKHRNIAGGEKSEAPVPQFPVDVFPACMEDFYCSIAESLPCPIDTPCVLSLPVLGTFVGPKYCVSPKDGFIQYSVLFGGLIDVSGNKKSPAYDKVTDPLMTRQSQLKATYRTQMEIYARATPEQRVQMKYPTMEQRVTTDCTMEELKNLLDEQSTGICYACDELSGWVRGMGQYKGGQGNDRQNWLSIWNCSPVLKNRVKGEPVYIERPYVCVTGNIQPSCLPDLIDDARQDGLAPRFLLGCPNPLPAESDEWNEETVKGDGQYLDICLAAIRQRIVELFPTAHRRAFGTPTR